MQTLHEIDTLEMIGIGPFRVVHIPYRVSESSAIASRWGDNRIKALVPFISLW
jgi:hypothetical protein